VEGPIMQEKEWMRAFGRCNTWSTRAGKLHRRNDRAGRKSRRGGARRHQASRPRPAGLPYLRSPRLPFSAGKLPSTSFVCVFKFVCPKPP
jgi:hypothetical protein